MALSTMEALDSHGTIQIVHIHNYSMYAIKSLISEIKKFPIIYKADKGFCFVRELTDLAWCRIILAILDCNGEFSSIERQYWDLSFREIWKWMRSILVKDMRARLQHPVYIRDPRYDWLDHLKFVEKHIYLDQETVEMKEADPNIRVQLISPETIAENSNHTVIWVRDSRESVANENEGISIYFRSTFKAPGEFTIKQTSSPVSLSFDCSTYRVPCSPVLQPLPASIAPSSASFFTWNPPSPSAASSTQVLPVPTVEDADVVVGQQQCVQLVIDEDFQFIMSLLPKLKRLDPQKNTDAKMLIMQALHDAF